MRRIFGILIVIKSVSSYRIANIDSNFNNILLKSDLTKFIRRKGLYLRNDKKDLIDEIVSSVNNQKEYDLSERATNRNSFDLSRFISFTFLSILLALGANFLGVTSFLLSSTQPDYFSSLGLDQIYSINGFRKNIDNEKGYEFVFPDNWLIDQTTLIKNLNRRDNPIQVRNKRNLLLPDVAYGPVNSDGKENLSVISSTVLPGFTLRGTLGDPVVAADTLLKNVIAPLNSDKTYELIDAKEENRNGMPVFIFEYVLKRENSNNPLFQHTLSVIASRGHIILI